MRLDLDPEELKPIVQAVVAQLHDLFDDDDDRLAFSEKEAAAMLGVPDTTLRDDRYLGRAKASLVGRKIRYTRQQLLDYLASREWEPKD
jgi:hypothetical protein